MSAAVKVLVVDDSGFSRNVIAGFVQKSRSGSTVEEAATAEIALEKLSTDTVYDLITIDLHMPGMDGLALVAELRNRDVKSPLALITANVQEAIRAKAEALAVHFVPKPVNADKIRNLLEEVCP